MTVQASRERVLDRRLASVLAGAAGAFLGFNLLLAVVPVIAEREGGEVGAGLATGVFMLTTVIGQVLVGALIRVVRPDVTFVIGLVLIGVPALLYANSDQLVMILAITALRGFGFGFCTVIATVLIVAQVSFESRGTALGMFGFVSSVSTVVAPSFGLWLLKQFGPAVYVVTAVTTVVLGLPVLLQRQPDLSRGRSATTFRQMLSRSEISRPLVVLIAGTLLFGGIYSFVPIVATDRVELALVVFGLTMAVTRTMAGLVAELLRPAIVLTASTASAAVGSLMIGLHPGGWPLLVGSALGGFGVGAMMTGSLLVVLARVTIAELGSASTLWNTGVDAGLALGGFGLALVAGTAGEDFVFLAAASALFAAIGLAAVDAHWREL